MQNWGQNNVLLQTINSGQRLCALVAVCCCIYVPRVLADASEGPAVQSLDVHMVVHSDGSASVSETYHFVPGANGIPDFVRTIYPREAPYAFPLKRQLSDIQVLDQNGVQIPDKQARYGQERTQVAATLPADRGTVVPLK